MLKFSQTILMMIFVFIVGSGFAFSQTDAKKAAKKDKSSAQDTVVKPLETKVNLMVLKADGKYAGDVKQEDCKIFEDGVEQKITYFAKKQEGLNVGLVIDNTGSMRTQLGNVVTAAATFVASIRPQDEVFIVRFVSSDNVQIVQDWTTDKSRLNEGLQNLFVEGGQSAIIDALYLSADKILEREKNEPSTRNALILISDGEDRDSYYKKQDVLDLFKGSDAQIFTIGFSGQLSAGSSKSATKNFINQISYTTGGAAFFVGSDKNEDLVAALKGILNELSSQYIVGYTPTNQKRGGAPRKIAVQVSDGANGEKRRTFVRENIVIPEEK